MNTQDPVKQEPQKGSVDNSKLAKDLLDQIAEKYSKNLFGGSDEQRKAIAESMTTAADEARKQELHSHAVDQEIYKTLKLRLDADSKKQDMELDVAKAVQDGTIPFVQDPKPPVTVPETKSPLNPTKEFVDAIADRQNYLKKIGQKPATSDAVDQDTYLRNELEAALKKVDEKNLNYSPLGKGGAVLGGLLDILSLGANVGTSIFGGTIGPSQKVELLGRAIAQTSPLVRAEMQDQFNRDKMSQNEQQFLQRRSLGSLGSHATNMDDAELITSMAIDARRTLTNSVPDSFGPNSVTGIGDAFNVYEGIHVLLDSLKEASTPEEITAISNKIVEADQAMRQPIQQFLARGGSIETLDSRLVSAIDALNKKYQQDLVYAGDKEAVKFQAKQKATIFELVDKLGDFRTAIIEDAKMDLPNVQALQGKMKDQLFRENLKRYDPKNLQDLFQKSETARKMADKQFEKLQSFK